MESLTTCPKVKIRLARRVLTTIVFIPALLLSTCMIVEQAFAVESCEELCAVVKEPGVSKLNTEGAPVYCCCLQNEEGSYDSKPEEQCRLADSASDAAE